MRKPLLSLAILLALAVAVAGCGGSSGGGSSSGSGGVKAADASKLANCLNNQDWITSPGGNSVTGSSATGANFALRIYQTDAAAKAAALKKPKKATAVIGTSVVTFVGAPTATSPGVPVAIPQSDFTTIKTCYDQST